jgi:regulator of replication initiation timing
MQNEQHSQEGADAGNASNSTASMPTQPGQGASGRYGALLQQVQQVSAELSEARVIIASFRTENEALAQNFERCKASLLDTRAKYQRAASELLSATERQVATDARHESFREEVTRASSFFDEFFFWPETFHGIRAHNACLILCKNIPFDNIHNLSRSFTSLCPFVSMYG